MNQYMITDVSVFIEQYDLQDLLDANYALGWRLVSSVICQHASVATGGSVLRLIFEKVQ